MLIPTLTVSLFALAALQQASVAHDAGEVLDRYFESVRDRGEALRLDLSEVAADDAAAIALLDSYVVNESHRVRWQAASLLYDVGKSSRDCGIRTQVTDRLARLAFDKDVGQSVSKWLLNFEEDDFSRQAKNLLSNEIRMGNQDRNLVYVAGVAGLHDLEGLLRDRADRGSLDAMFALIRMGDETRIDAAIVRVDREPNHVSRSTILLERLAYTRHPKAYRYIGTFLNSDERLPQVKNNVPGTPVAQRAMDILVREVPGCPIGTDGHVRYSYTREEIAIVRDWLRENF